MRILTCLLLALGAASCRIDDFDEDGFSARDDCDNLDPDIHPDADEICDEVDNNCDGEVDEGFDGTTLYADVDGDGFGNDDATSTGCSPGLAQVEVGGDCDDQDAFVNPDAPELCDGKDNDCNGDTDENVVEVVWYADTDGDGFGVSDDFVESCTTQAGHSTVAGDCDDADASVHPGATEPCGGPDHDCDSNPAPLCQSCLDLRDNGVPDAGSGLYEVDFDGTGTGASETVYCDMTTDGGGWTLVQRTVWSWTENEPLYSGYSVWYDDTLGDPAPGQAFRLAGKHWPALNGGRDHLVTTALRTTTGGTCTPLVYKATEGTLTVTSTTATLSGVVQPVLLFVGTELSTNDSGPAACGLNYQGVPWFYGNCCSVCPTFKSTYWADEPHPMSNRTGEVDFFGNNRMSVCALDTPLVSGTSNYYGVNVMEYYLR